MDSEYAYSSDQSLMRLHEDFFEVLGELQPGLVAVLILTNFIYGFNIFLEMVLLMIYKDADGAQPSELSLLMILLTIPRTIMLLYGLCSDNVTMCGSKRKSHIIVNVICAIVIISLLIGLNYRLPKAWMTTLFFLLAMNVAYVDTITAAMTVQSAKRPYFSRGAEKL